MNGGHEYSPPDNNTCNCTGTRYQGVNCTGIRVGIGGPGAQQNS